jgi:very-short-patch-repair endonuclease
MSLPLEQIVIKYNNGASLHELAEQYHTYPNKILRLLKKAGIPIRKKSEALKNAVSRGRKVHPTAGKKRTDEERLKISQGMDDFYDKMTPEQYNNLIQRAKKNWKRMPKDTIAIMQKRSADANRKAAKEGSSVEKYMKYILEENHYIVEFHKKNLLHTDLEVDIFLPKESVAIEIDGPTHFKPIFGDEQLKKQIKFDTEKNGILLSVGLVLIRVKYTRSKLTLGVKNKIKTAILELLDNIKTKFPPENERLIELII